MEAIEHKKQIDLTVEEIIKCEYKNDLEKEISNLIYNVQLYERKGGKENLW